MTLFFKNHEITIFRRRRIGSSDRYGMSATYTAYPADIQPASQERTQFASGRFGAVYTAFIDANVDIKENDYIHTEAGAVYTVKGVQKWQGAGLLDHIELILTSVDANG
jgi:hypothetical protein